ncbi:MAG: TIGR00725 family protein [Desulfuromonadales bacterium]|nr:TIGR00725 family protein [Desulfuromonadales bacterium]
MRVQRKTIIGVIGASRATEQGLEMARVVGAEIARRGAVLVCGGLGGVMEAASRGCAERGGEVLGLLPGSQAGTANPFVTIAVPTNMGHARNVIIAHTADALIAIEGEYGTLSEMAISLKLGKPVVVLPGGHQVAGVLPAEDPCTAVDLALERLEKV